MRVTFVLLLCAVLVPAIALGAGTSNSGDLLSHRTVRLGRSVDGRSIMAVETGDFDSPRKALVVGCIHGNECAGVAVADRLAQSAPPREVDLWVVPNLNPDGRAAGTRQNAHGVDLNRNFPRAWRRMVGLYDSGQRPLSEPESRIAVRLIERVRPSVSIWFHQHRDVVDDSSGSIAIERTFATVAKMRLEALVREPGSAVTWQSHCLPHSTAFVVELAAGALGADAVARLGDAVLAAAAASPERRVVARC
ncbi:MAG TPA: M14 family zinc carboxypeptidase [Gaiellaceae bacterium]|nr:M14 family zinc carboxypeptidase [Gaiellaceae bacterium]